MMIDKVKAARDLCLSADRHFKADNIGEAIKDQTLALGLAPIGDSELYANIAGKLATYHCLVALRLVSSALKMPGLRIETAGGLRECKFALEGGHEKVRAAIDAALEALPPGCSREQQNEAVARGAMDALRALDDAPVSRPAAQWSAR